MGDLTCSLVTMWKVRGANVWLLQERHLMANSRRRRCLRIRLLHNESDPIGANPIVEVASFQDAWLWESYLHMIFNIDSTI